MEMKRQCRHLSRRFCRFVSDTNMEEKSNKKTAFIKTSPNVNKFRAVAGIGLLNNDKKIMNAAAGLQVNANPTRIAAAACPVLIWALSTNQFVKKMK